MKKQISDEKLYGAAEKVRVNAYAPFSAFQVGAALITDEGRVYTGVNVENSSYGASICAERTAFVKAISEGERIFCSIAISAGETESIPCGICRQFMYEFAPDIRIITKADGQLKVQALGELLPQGFVLRKQETWNE